MSSPIALAVALGLALAQALTLALAQTLSLSLSLTLTLTLTLTITLTRAQLDTLRATPGCRVHAAPRAGHWCYKHAPDLCFEAVRAFILDD